MIHLNFSEHVATDILHGCVVVLCTLCAFIGLVWLREQILHGGGPDWLEQDVQNEVLPPIFKTLGQLKYFYDFNRD